MEDHGRWLDHGYPRQQEFTSGTADVLEDARAVAVGDRVVPSLVRVHFPGLPPQPALTLLIELINGVPRCVDVHVAAPTDAWVRAEDLETIKLREWTLDTLAFFAQPLPKVEGGVTTIYVRDNPTPDTSAVEAMYEALSNARGPRKLTPEFLAEVARVYQAAPHAQRNKEIREHFGVGQRTATHYISVAREKGVLPPSGKGKR